MSVLAVILARAGSKGLPDKCVLPLCGRPMLAYTIGHARQAESLDAVVLTTDSERAAAIGREHGVFVVERPPELADDRATVDAAARHALEVYERENDYHADAVVLLYANVPIRADGIIDRCVRHLFETGADSVRTLAAVGKMHPDWMHRLDGDRMIQYRENSIYRRQDLEPVYMHDAAVIAVTRGSLYTPPAHEEDFHAFFGEDRRGVVQAPEDTVDVDTLADFYHAEAILRTRSEAVISPGLESERRLPILTGAVAFTQHERR
ncbi:MAG: acylneuraminate cytidylyltransferase family protein [Phycisphaerae bacterium]|nr:acylneuraminate cytidylyltransferase family protein [Phycisphaerae bacterium]